MESTAARQKRIQLGKEIFGEYLKKLREDRKLTLREVEKAVKVSNAYLSQLERGKRGMPTVKILERLAEAYGISTFSLTDTGLKAYCLGTPETTPPSPNVEYIGKVYLSLSEENKKAFMDFLLYLQKKDSSETAKKEKFIIKATIPSMKWVPSENRSIRKSVVGKTS